MAREVDEILRQQVVKQADSCMTDDGVSFLEKVISPLYDVIAAVGVSFILFVTIELCLNCVHLV